MADYVSSLTGSAMDAALLDMAEHNSEAWAVGERNGIAVDSSDVAYHNNARYYAQQAQSIAPASVTEAVRWDVAQTALTDANRLQARENIKATSHNYNLLDNGWFLVNSRNVTTVSTNYSYGADRWLLNTGSVTFAIGSMTLAASSNIGQRMDIPNGTYTASVKLSDGTIISGSGTVGSTTTTFISNDTVELDYFGTQLPRNFRIYNTSGSALTIVAVKIELGSFSTLANDTPPDYGEELTRCIYSTADPTDPYANNGFGRTNPNLIDNPWFTIQQRGASAFTAAGYTADRWQKQGATGIVTPTANGLKFEKNGASYVEVRYYDTLDKYATIGNGKSFTLSILLQNGTVQHQSFVMASSGLDTNLYYAISSTNDFRVNLYTTSTLFVVRVLCYTDFTLRAIKLEQGTVSTLANDTPPDYGTELAKCQRYFIRVAPTAYTTLWSGVCINASTFAFNITTPVPMRYATPTITFTGTLDFVEQTTSGGAIRTVTGLTAYAPVSDSNNIRVLATTASTLGSNNLACIYTYAYTSVIDISCDL